MLTQGSFCKGNSIVNIQSDIVNLSLHPETSHTVSTEPLSNPTVDLHHCPLVLCPHLLSVAEGRLLCVAVHCDSTLGCYCLHSVSCQLLTDLSHISTREPQKALHTSEHFTSVVNNQRAVGIDS